MGSRNIVFVVIQNRRQSAPAAVMYVMSCPVHSFSPAEKERRGYDALDSPLRHSPKRLTPRLREIPNPRPLCSSLKQEYDDKISKLSRRKGEAAGRIYPVRQCCKVFGAGSWTGRVSVEGSRVGVKRKKMLVRFETRVLRIPALFLQSCGDCMGPVIIHPSFDGDDVPSRGE